MRTLLSIFILLIAYKSSLAQQKTSPIVLNSCDCEQIITKPAQKGKDAFPTLSKAQEVYKSFLTYFPEFASMNVAAVSCLSKKNPAKALMCQSGTSKTRYILYDNEGLSAEENTWFDKFVLAHELGHHVRNHFHDGTTYNPKTDELYNKRNFKFYNKNVIQELEADQVAVFLIKKLGGNLAEIIKTIEDRADPATEDHPSSKERSQFISACWKKVNLSRDFAADFHDKYNKKVYGFTFEVLGGWVMSNPRFSKNNEIVNASLLSRPNKPTFKVGLRFSYININFPIRPEVEVNYLAHNYVTLDAAKTSKAEEFSFQHVNIIPQATFSTLSFSKDKFTIPRWAFTASAGLAVNIPVAYSYSNYYTSTTPAMSKSDLETTYNPTFALGIERKPIRDKIVKYFRVSARYSPMPLGIPSSNPQDKLSTKSHLMDLSLSLRLWN